MDKRFSNAQYSWLRWEMVVGEGNGLLFRCHDLIRTHEELVAVRWPTLVAELRANRKRIVIINSWLRDPAPTLKDRRRSLNCLGNILPIAER